MSLCIIPYSLFCEAFVYGNIIAKCSWGFIFLLVSISTRAFDLWFRVTKLIYVTRTWVRHMWEVSRECVASVAVNVCITSRTFRIVFSFVHSLHLPPPVPPYVKVLSEQNFPTWSLACSVLSTRKMYLSSLPLLYSFIANHTHCFTLAFEMLMDSKYLNVFTSFLAWSAPTARATGTVRRSMKGHKYFVMVPRSKGPRGGCPPRPLRVLLL